MAFSSAATLLGRPTSSAKPYGEDHHSPKRQNGHAQQQAFAVCFLHRYPPWPAKKAGILARKTAQNDYSGIRGQMQDVGPDCHNPTVLPATPIHGTAGVPHKLPGNMGRRKRPRMEVSSVGSAPYCLAFSYWSPLWWAFTSTPSCASSEEHSPPTPPRKRTGIRAAAKDARPEAQRTAGRARPPDEVFRYRGAGGRHQIAQGHSCAEKTRSMCLIYGPPGVGKTCAARLVLEAAKKSNGTPFWPTPPLLKWTRPACASMNAPSQTP